METHKRNLPIRDKIPEKRRDAFVMKSEQKSEEAVKRTFDRKGTFFTQLGACINQERRNSLFSRVHPGQKSWLQQKHSKIFSKEFVHTEVPIPREYGGIFSCRFQHGGQRMILGFGMGNIQLCDFHGTDLGTTIKPGDENDYPIMSMRFHPKKHNIVYAGSSSGFVWQCDVDANDYALFAEERDNEVNSLDINFLGTLIATGGKDAVVRIYDPETKHLVNMYSNPDLNAKEDIDLRFHKLRLFAVRFHPEYSDILVTGGWDNAILVWDIRNKERAVKKIIGSQICGEAIDMCGKTLITGSWLVSGSLQKWDMGSGRLIETIHPRNRSNTLDGEFIYTLQYFDGDPYGNQVLCGGSGTGAFEIINLKTSKVTASYRVHKPIYSLDSYGNCICFGGMEPCFRAGQIVT